MDLTADDEWVQGPDVISVLHDRAELIDTRRLEFDRIEAYESGDFGWTASALVATFGDGATRMFRNTTTFVLQDAVWKAVQIHTSVGVPASDVFGVELGAGLSALVDSLSGDSGEELQGLSGDCGLVTVMFTDIVGSTQLAQQRGDGQWSHDVQAHFGAVAEVVEACGGRVVKTLGDGSMAAFPSASGAADAAIRIHRFEDEDVRVRIGIHTGEAVAVGDDYAGVAIAKAARIASAAHGGETLISSASRELINRFDYTLGEPLLVELKGLGGTHRLYPLSEATPPGAP